MSFYCTPRRAALAVIIASAMIPQTTSGQASPAPSKSEPSKTERPAASPRVGPEFALANKNQPTSPLDVLREFEHPASGSYIFGEGDEISVDVFSHPELSGKRVIGPDGKVTLPVVGDVQLANLSREDGHQAVMEAFAKYYAGLSVELQVDVYTSNRIFILGRVAAPGALHFETPPTLLEVITRAGSLPIGGIGADKAAMNRCVIFRGREKVVWVDLKPLLKDGNLLYNLQLQRNDVVYIPDSDDQSVYVLGEVLHPGAYNLRPDMTFMDAYAEAGGATKDGVADHIQLIRPSLAIRREVAMRNIMHPDPNLNFALRDGDILYVPKRGLAKFGYLMDQFGAASGLAIVGKELAP